MIDLFVKTKAEFNRQKSDLLHVELATCSRNADLASTMCRAGNRQVADRTIADAESSYATVLRLLSDPIQAKRLTIRATQELTQRMQALREKLDELKRLKSDQ